MCGTSTGHGTDAGTSRKAHGLDEKKKLLQAAAEALHERVGSSKGMVWCLNVIQKSLMRRHVAMRCPELPTVRQRSNLPNCITRRDMSLQILLNAACSNVW